MHLYLSFARIDEPYALQIAHTLQRDHTFAYDDRLFAPHWWQRTLIRLDSSDALLYFISPEGAAAEYCRRECEVMLQAGRAVIPILIVDGAPVLLMLEGYTMLDLRSGITPEGEAALRAVLAAVKVDKSLPVYGVEAAQRPFEVAKDDPGALITEANQEAFEEKWERVVYLLRSALATGFRSELVDVDKLLNDAEASFLSAQYERKAGRAYAALRRIPYRFSDLEAFRADVRNFAYIYPDYDPDGIFEYVGIQPAKSYAREDSSIASSVPRRVSDSERIINFGQRLVSGTQLPLTLIAFFSLLMVCGVVCFLFSLFAGDSVSGTVPTITPRVTPMPTSSVRPAPLGMHLIEGGCFNLNENGSGMNVLESDSVCVNDYWLDPYEVSNLQFYQYGGEAELTPPNTVDIYPRTNISFREARDFCQQRGARLPTEAEWQYAISGEDNWRFPWGNDFMPERANLAGDSDGYPLTAPITAFSEYESSTGIVNLIGNVAEWVDDEDYNDIYHSIRGGSYRNSYYARVGFLDRDTRSYRYASDDLGFRCARDA